jgi:acetyltransferase EpsM
VTIAIIGAGSQGRILAEILQRDNSETPVEIFDDDSNLHGTSIGGARVVGGVDRLDQGGEMIVTVAMGNPKSREKVVNKLTPKGVCFGNIVASSAETFPSAKLGFGCMLHPQSILNSKSILGDHVLINNRVVVEHDSELEDFVTVCPGALVGGRVRIEEGAFIGTGAILLPRLKIGAGSIVAAGAIVTRDVPPQTLMMGSPARSVRRIDNDFDWGRLL